MKIYLDDDSANSLLVRLLTKEGHDVVIPPDLNCAGQKDARHFAVALKDGRTILTGNHHDYELLHELVLAAGGHHFGIFSVRKDNDPKRDLTPAQIVRAVRKLLAASVPLTDELHVLNHWR